MMRTSAFTPVSSQSAPEAIVRRLMDAIVSGELGPGAKLPREPELARSLGVAPMTLRNALASLRELGYVVTIRGRLGGSFVVEDIGERLFSSTLATAMTAEEIRSLTDWRRAISGEASFLAAQRGTRTEFSNIRDAAATFDKCVDDAVRRRMSDARLHTLIAETSRSEDLLREETKIQEKMNLILPQTIPLLVNDTPTMHHDDLIVAITKKDAERARLEMLKHVESTYEWCCALLKTPPVSQLLERRSREQS